MGEVFLWLDIAAYGNAQGRSVLFTNNGDDYLFVQGGTAGTSDDFLMELYGASGSTMANAVVTLKGEASDQFNNGMNHPGSFLMPTSPTWERFFMV